MKILRISLKKNVILSTNENVFVNIGTEQMQNSEKLLGIKIDSKLNFKDKLVRTCIQSQCQIKCFESGDKLNES